MLSKRTWSIYGSVALFHGVMILFYQVPFHKPAMHRHMLPSSPVVMAAGTAWDQQIKSHPLVRNPMLMAQANERGFTSELWNTSFKSKNPYSDWGESPRYLQEPKTGWGDAFLEFAQQTSQAMWNPITKPKAELDAPLPENPFHQARSHIQFSNNLEARLPEHLPDLAVWDGTTPLPPTHLQIGIDPLGFVQSVRIIDPPSPDPKEQAFIQQAIGIFKTLMFQRAPDWNNPSAYQLEWGDAEIQWMQQRGNLPAAKQPEGDMR